MQPRILTMVSLQFVKITLKKLILTGLFFYNSAQQYYNPQAANYPYHAWNFSNAAAAQSFFSAGQVQNPYAFNAFHPYALQGMTNDPSYQEEVKQEKEHYEANVPTPNHSPIMGNAMGFPFNKNDLANVTLKKPRVTFSSQQVLHLEQEFKNQR